MPEQHLKWQTIIVRGRATIDEYLEEHSLAAEQQTAFLNGLIPEAGAKRTSSQ